MAIFQSLLTNQLSTIQIDQIIQLKNSYWNYGLKSQTEWFSNNVKKQDKHNLMIIDKTIIGYTFLGERKLINNKFKKEAHGKYLLFATLIIEKNYRNYNFLSKLMKFNLKIISQNNMPSFLLCKSKTINLYKLFGWKLLNKNQLSTPDHKHNLNSMIYNYDNFEGLEKNKFKIFYNL
jgi:hypothetical protein